MNESASLGHLVNRTARLLRRLADQRLAPLGLSAGYLPVLTTLLAEGVASQKTLTERAGIEQPTMVATLQRMQRDGVITRRIDPKSQRSALFALTAKTLTQADAIHAAIHRWHDDALAGLSQADQAKLGKLLQTVAATTEKITEPASERSGAPPGALHRGPPDKVAPRRRTTRRAPRTDR